MIPPVPINPRPPRATIQIGRPVKGSVPPGGEVEVDLDGTAVVGVEEDVGFPCATSVTLNEACKVGAVADADVNGGSILLPDDGGSVVAGVVEDGAVVGVMGAACPPVVLSVAVGAAGEVMVVSEAAVASDADVVVEVNGEVDVVETTTAGGAVI
jgi:hypothetical protein